jgi:hypothetical protein
MEMHWWQWGWTWFGWIEMRHGWLARGHWKDKCCDSDGNDTEEVLNEDDNGPLTKRRRLLKDNAIWNNIWIQKTKVVSAVLVKKKRYVGEQK